MSSRDNIQNILKNPQIFERIVENLPVSIENTRDITNLSVWGILHKTDKENLLRLLDYYEDKKNNLEEDIDRNLIREFKKIGVKIIRFIDSLGTHKKSNLKTLKNSELIHKMTIPGVALEYFLIDSITRLYYGHNQQVQIEKGPSELEGKKIDFILKIYENLKLGVQLTLSEGSSINKKRGEIHKVRTNIEQKEWTLKQEKLMSSKYIIDVPIFMIINSEISRQTHNNGILLTAFNKWKEDGFLSGGPSTYLEQKIQKELKKIGFSLPITTKKALDFIKNIYENGDKNKYQEQKINNLHLVYDGDKVKVSFFNKEKYGAKKSNFIYSIEIFITDKLIQKLEIEQKIID